MQRDQSIAIRQAVFWNLYRTRKKADKGIDHYIPDAEDFSRRNSLALKVDITIFRRSKQHIGKPIGDNSINLFRHGAVEGTKSSFDVDHPNQQLRTNQS